MSSLFVRSSPVLGSVLTAQSLEPALDSVSSSPLLLALSQKLINIKIKKKILGSIYQQAFMLISFDVKLDIKNKCISFVKLFDHCSVG